MNKQILISFLVLLLTEICSPSQDAINLEKLISGADLHYDKPVVRSEEGMPVGNGRMGSLVWTTPSTLKFQVNRVDIFGNNASSNSFFERNTDYCSGAGFVDIEFVTWGDDVFTSPDFNQHLSCYDAVVSTDGNKIKTQVIVWNEQDVMASGSRGSFPPKFNGMIWTTGGDARKWGNNYWGANQSCMYNGLFPANRPELIEPMFRMYSAMFPSLEVAARQQWGSTGIYIPETVAFDGLPELPEKIADEMQSLYLVRKSWSEKSREFNEYASTKSPFQSRWNWKQDKGSIDGKWTFTDKGAQTFGHVTHIFSRGAKIAYQYWQRYEFTRDIEWLRSTGYPVIKGVTEFYRNFPNIKKEADGKYHIYNVNDNESVRGGHNTVEEISSMMGIFPAAIRASEILGIDPELRLLWKEFVQNLSPLPLNTDHPETYKIGSPVTFVRSLQPVVQGPGSGRPDPNTMPVWFFDLCNPVAGNTEMVKIANSTFDSYFPDGINKNSRVYVLSKLAVTGTMMGRKDATRYLIPNQIRTAEIETMSNRMTLREGYQTTGVQNLGRMADALHYALINSSPPGPAQDPVITLFPAWPEEWDADFKLLARGNFLVTSSFRNGKITHLEIFSGSGSECRLINPWPGSSVTVFRNVKKSESLRGNTLTFKTKPGEEIALSPYGK